MKFSAHLNNRAFNLRAFNLIESAIVLAVIGLVIGGIWYASASVSESRRVSELRAAIVGMHTRAQQIFSTANVATGNTVLALNAQQSGVVLGDWTYQPSGYYINRAGDQVQLVLASSPCTGVGAVLAIRVITPRAVCIKLVSGIGGSGQNNVSAFYWSNQAVCQSVMTAPLTMAEAQTRCAANSNFSLQMPLGSSN